jgi:hypothetical protein
MFDQTRHAPLSTIPWNPDAVRAAIQDIVADAEAHFTPDRWWPAHPMDERIPDGMTGLYFGAAGMIWGMDFLRREGAADHGLDFAPMLPRLLEANTGQTAPMLPAFGMEAERTSYLFGDPPIRLMMIRAGVPGAADDLYQRIDSNRDLPILELMWGAAGTMLASVFAFEMTGEDRWRTLYQAQATRMLAELEDGPAGPIWTQALYGQRLQYLGAVHGYAGNLQALLRGWDWLAADQQARVTSAALASLAANAWRSDEGVNWSARAPRDAAPSLVQYCHGAPGMVTAFADPRIAGPELTDLLEGGGRLTWAAGPLAKGSNLCHGTGGNGFAFLKLFALTGDPVWRDHARAFAMTAIDQYHTARAELGRGRYTLWTGDLGLAVFMHECLKGTARFPTVDVF